MTSKSYPAYNSAFSNLLLKCEEFGIKVEPKFLMCDFELGLRKALRKCFPTSTIAGCYFHYCKALWSYAGSHSLTTAERLQDSIKLVTFLKILAHIEIKDRKELYDDLSSIFKKKDPKFTDMLNYYKNNWLNTFYVESVNVGEEDNTTLLARTNNVCEFYNHRLNQKVAIANPRLSILVNCLLDEELILREFLTKSTVNVPIEPIIPDSFSVKEDELPIGSISKLLEKKKSLGYNLRSIMKDHNFIDECKALVQRCYESVFVSSKEAEEVGTIEENKSVESEGTKNMEQVDDDYDDSNSGKSNFTQNLCKVLEQEKIETENPCIDVLIKVDVSATSSKR